MNYLIRQLEERDLPELITLCAHHAEYEEAGYDPVGKADLLKTAIFCNTPKLYCLVVEVDDKLVGYVSYTFDFSTWDASLFLYMDCLYMEPDYRNKGIGAVIFDKLKEAARERNCVNIQWQTPIFNKRAVNFYLRIGGLVKEKSRFILPTR
jgi:GNAT superfamily N-acetyltransferase